MGASSVPEETHSPYKLCAFCEQPLLPEQRPFIQVENGEEAHLVCWSKHQDSAPPTASEAERQLAWEKLCDENDWHCRICGALPELGQQFDNNLCDDCRFSLKNFDPTSS